MEFSDKQLQTLKERFAVEKMKQVSQNSRAKKPRIYTPHYERADIATLISESTTVHKRPFTYVFGKKTYIKESDMKYYEGFTIYYE